MRSGSDLQCECKRGLRPVLQPGADQAASLRVSEERRVR